MNFKTKADRILYHAEKQGLLKPGAAQPTKAEMSRLAKDLRLRGVRVQVGEVRKAIERRASGGKRGRKPKNCPHCGHPIGRSALAGLRQLSEGKGVTET